MSSNNLPSIAVIIPTFNRAIIVTRAVKALKDNLNYGGDIHYYVSVDGEDDTERLLEATFGTEVYVTQGPHTGLGGNLNFLIRGVPESFLFQMDDDHILKAPINLTPHVTEMLTYSEAAWVRLMGIGSHNYDARLRHQYWYVSWTSPELYIPSNRPHLKHKRFHEAYGLYTEGVTLAQTEERFCHQCRDIASGMIIDPPQVLVPLNSNSETAWDHVGESWQGKGY